MSNCFIVVSPVSHIVSVKTIPPRITPRCTETMKIITTLQTLLNLSLTVHFTNLSKYSTFSSFFKYTFSLKLHPHLCVRTPQSTSANRILGFTKENVKQFFDLYEKELYRLKLRNDPTRIYNVD